MVALRRNRIYIINEMQRSCKDHYYYIPEIKGNRNRKCLHLEIALSYDHENVHMTSTESRHPHDVTSVGSWHGLTMNTQKEVAYILRMLHGVIVGIGTLDLLPCLSADTLMTS